MKIYTTLSKAFSAVLFFAAIALSYAQRLPADSISVKQEYQLPDPTRYEAFYDIKIGMYYVYPKVGDLVTGDPMVMTPQEYQDFMMEQMSRDYYREKSDRYSLMFRKDKTDARRKGLVPELNIRNKLFEAIFGGNKIEIIPSGYASFDLGGLYQKIDNPLILPQNRKSFSFDIDQRIQLGLLGKVGENLQLRANYDTQSGFAFENRMNLVWQAKGTWRDLQTKGLSDPTTGGEDRIIKRVEFGNVNMPLSTSLIRGSESLFGLKTEFQLGKTYGTLVLSQQQGEARNIVVQGGGVMSTFKINAIDYEDNQHYFLGHHFLNEYDNALLSYPQINSRISINRLEVWVLDQGNGNLAYQKSIVGVRDLGEGAGLPDNAQSGVYQAVSGLGAPLRDVNTAYNTINQQVLPTATGAAEPYADGENFIFNRKARRLSDTEFSYHPQLGYISLNQRLNDNQLLAVSYSYTVNGSNRVYKVGEFSEESPVLITKLLKPNTNVRTSSPMWDLMMKNIYALNAMQINPDGFLMNVYYKDPQTGGKVNYLPNTPVENTNLLNLLNWDRLNLNNDVQQDGGTTGDGIFDFVPQITVRPEEGRIMFTKVQPFGSYLQNVLGSNNPQYVFNDLYTQQKQVASQSNLALRYTMEGRYKGLQGQGISLGAMNVPQGSVKVTANGVQLTEGVDYTVDYMLGSVTIINEQVKQSGQAINISLENQLTFNTQRKRFLGLNLERKFSDNFIVGGTVVNYSETPLTQKVNFGSESVNNTMAGVNVMYNNQFPFLTRLADKIPLVNTEAPSNLNFRMEAAYLLPGINDASNNQSYIDDFEQTTSKISLKEPSVWSLASKPEKNQGDPAFAGAGQNNSLANGNGRALLSWYSIDPRFWGVGGDEPNGINAQAVSNHASRRVKLQEIYNSRDFVAGEQIFTNTMDLTIFPDERGPYNVNQNPEAPLQRWGGLMRPINVSNFINSNIEYIEFWMMDPYADGNTLGVNPRILLQLGNVSEDVLKDGQLQYENGLPTPSSPAATSASNWGTQPKQPPILYAFSTEGDERQIQDVGFDGLDDASESTIFPTGNINPVLNTPDPAADNFVFYLSDKFNGNLASSVPQRYKYFRNPDGNSASNSMEVASQTPDAEDVNRDYNLDQGENYNQYTISLDQSSLVLGSNNIVDVKTVKATFQNGNSSDVKWYLFRIPVSGFDAASVGGDAQLSILNNVRFARMLLTGFNQTSTIRLGSFDLVRSDWRRYTKNIYPVFGVEEGSQEVDNSNFEVGSVNLEENGLNKPPYVLPPGIDRQVVNSNAGAQRQNESSLYLKATQLGGINREARGVFKNTALDLRRFGKLKLFVHAEDLLNKNSSRLDKNAKFFIRFGSDATDNYYEYESSLRYTAASAVSPLDIWPAENEVDFELQNFVDLKIRRDKNTPGNIMTRYTDAQFGTDLKRIYIKGRPSIGSITTVMVGIRYIDESEQGGDNFRDIALWVNEIRLSDIENKGGYAGNASLNFNLGDFAVVNTNAAYSTVGFGNIDSRPAERTQSTQSAVNVNTTINVDKFLPEKAGLKIPVNYSYSQTIEDPKYNPLDNDVKFTDAPNREELETVARTYTQQRSLGIVGMHKERMNPNRQPRFYDVENLTLSMIYNDDYYRDIYTKKNYRQYLRGNVDYNFNFKPWVIRPFNKMISDTAKSYKYLRWVKEFNFNPVPSRFAFRTEIDRNYNELEFRNVDAILNGNRDENFGALKNRNFYFGWQYALDFNFTKSLKLAVNSATRTLNDHTSINTMDKRSIFEQPFRAGRPVLYNHTIQLNYRLPFEYFPLIDFVNAELAYGMNYNWHTQSTALLNSPEGSLGTIGQNSNNIRLAGALDFPRLFEKSSYYKRLNTTMQKREQEIDSLNTVYTQAWEKKRFRFKNYKFKNKLTPVQSLAYMLTSFKQLDFNFEETNGTVLPGLLSAPNWYGYGQTLGGPTVGFLLGSQADIRRRAIENGWISSSSLMIDEYIQNKHRRFDAGIQLMPLNDLRIDFNVLHTYTRNFVQGGYNVDAIPDTPADPASLGFNFSFGTEMITHSNTAWMFRTAFTSGDEVYRNIIANAQIISQQMGGALTPSGFTDGHSVANAYVLIPAFQAAVEGRSPKGPITNAKKANMPVPNWRLVYSGLRNIPFINGRFSKFDILHGYNSTYSAAGIQSSTDYFNTPFGRDINGDFYNPFTFAQVGYVEQFAPLVGVDVTMRNNMQLRAHYNRDRMFMLGLVNHTLTEDSGQEYVAGFGYIIRNFKLGVQTGRGKQRFNSDLNIRADFALRNNQTRISNILLADSQVTGGQRLLTIKASADYNVNQNLNLKLFYDQMMTKYKISTAFPLTTVRAGISATFTFGGEGGF